jgi:hypothetical protein
LGRWWSWRRGLNQSFLGRLRFDRLGSARGLLGVCATAKYAEEGVSGERHAGRLHWLSGRRNLRLGMASRLRPFGKKKPFRNFKRFAVLPFNLKKDDLPAN